MLIQNLCNFLTLEAPNLNIIADNILTLKELSRTTADDNQNTFILFFRENKTWQVLFFLKNIFFKKIECCMLNFA